MKKSATLSLLFIILTAGISGQADPKAVALLDKFSSSASDAPSVSMKFMLVTVDQVENSTDTIAGSVILSRDNYRLELPDNIVWFNGETSWSYLPAEEEVTVTKPDKKDNSFQGRPSSIFTMYRKGYKVRLVDERSDSWIIDLYPEEIKNELIRVRLTIANPSLHLKNLEYKRRDGITVTLIVKDYDLRKVPEPGMFIYPSDKYRDAEIIDMR